MSFLSGTSPLSLSQIGQTAGISDLNPATIPADVRDGNSTARSAYAEGLAFEQVLVSQLTEQMAQTMSGSGAGDGSSTGADGSGSSTGSSGLLSGEASGFSSLIPQALSSAIMDGGGLGMANEFAQAIDPSLGTGTAASSGPATTSTDPTPTTLASSGAGESGGAPA